VVVEFVGVPGVGKSTISHAVAERLRGAEAAPTVTEPSYELSRRPGATGPLLLRKALGLFARHPWVTLHWLRMIRASRQDSLNDFSRTSLDVLSSVVLGFRWCRSPGIHLFDQGLVQAVSSVLSSASGPSDEAALAAAAEQALGGFGHIVVVFVETDPETVAIRLENRPGKQSRLELLDDPASRLQAIKRTRRAVSATRRIVEGLQERTGGRCTIMTVTNELNGLEDAVRAVVTAVGRCCP
jgi:shikimate kinase